ncbi:hypothetical protein B296_00025147 [Ensete ventricosum]|uniref:Uncharacterized protein n=1 Tax=Ensete ventricosum TaxID=4639 RepID=A0A426X5U6_ENSVE|nr:hypothetical protein B296_00025147 [Ensete ventricosum]
MKGAMELQPDDGPRSSLGLGPGSDDAVEHRREFAKRFAEWIRKLAGNMSGDRQKKATGLIARMPEAAGLDGRFGLHSKKIGSGRRCASRRRTREWM